MDRLEKINAIVKAKQEAEVEKARKDNQRNENLKNKILELLPRVQELCKLIHALDEAELLQTRSQDGKDFFTDGWTHKLGFTYLQGSYSKEVKYTFNHVPSHSRENYYAIGKEGGGACRYSLALLENGELYAEGKDIDWAMTRFLEDFDKFEKSVFSFIDNYKA